jgi:ribonucleoside-diphosphate reductase alpha chain
MNEINFTDEMANFLMRMKYSRYDKDLKRRETWEESIERDMNMHLKKYNFLPKERKDEIRWAFELVKQKKCIPSMRSVQFGGDAIFSKNERIYNCSVRHIDSLRSFAESFFLLLCGNGVGFGLSEKYLGRLPDLVTAEDKNGIVMPYIIEDTIEGWGNSVEALLSCYFRNTPFTGRKIAFDYSRIRKKGEPLKTGGGKAPGYRGLKNAHIKIKQLLDFIIEEKNQARLKVINAYDILMHCADAVLSGGIRRSACSVIFMLNEIEMIEAKIDFDVLRKGRFEQNEKTGKWEGYVIVNDSVYKGKLRLEVQLQEGEYKYLMEQKKISWIHVHPQRARSNNSILLLREEVTKEQFKEVIDRTLQYGEPGFVFANDEDILLNPCFEISFRPLLDNGVCGVQFCNLTSINGSKVQTEDDFYELCKAQTIIGTLQAGYTDFPFLNTASKQLTESESLLGCSITGMMNKPDILLNEEILRKGAQVCVDTNTEWSDLIGINPAKRITCIKPEGSGNLVIADGKDIPASGIHPHHAHRYFRRVQVNKMDPIYKYFKKHNPHMCEESVWSANKTDDVVTFPIELRDENIITKNDITALEHLEYVKMVQKNWVIPGTRDKDSNMTHNVSVTIEVDEHEWNDVISYLFDNKEYFTAVSLLPKLGDKIFNQAPLERIVTDEDEEKLKIYKEKYRKVDYNQLIESDDNTTLQMEMTCSGGSCDITI